MITAKKIHPAFIEITTAAREHLSMHTKKFGSLLLIALRNKYVRKQAMYHCRSIRNYTYICSLLQIPRVVQAYYTIE